MDKVNGLIKYSRVICYQYIKHVKEIKVRERLKKVIMIVRNRICLISLHLKISEVFNERLVMVTVPLQRKRSRSIL